MQSRQLNRYRIGYKVEGTMPVRIIESKQNARLKELRKALAAPPRDACGLAGIEGPKMLEEALRAGLRVPAVFVAQGSERLLETLRLPSEIEILYLPKKLLDPALATKTPQLVAALVEPPQWTWEHLLGLRRNAVPLVIVLAGLQDPGNLGTILRSAEAFGATGVVSLPGTVSVWNSKAVRASAGSVFRVPVLAAGADECFPRLHGGEVTIWATVANRAKAANEVNLARPTALLIGNEGNGVPGDLLARADALVTIPCPGPVESLNAAVAASVLLYEASRQRGVSHPFNSTARSDGERVGKQTLVRAYHRGTRR
jgi:RNA methyltransferase, TrmH family